MATFVHTSQATLEGFFSAPIAKAIIGAASKRADSIPREYEQRWRALFEAELQKLLAIYLPEPGKRADCLTRLQQGREPMVAAPKPYERTRSSQQLKATAASTSVVVRDQADIPNACEVVRDLGKKLGFSAINQTKMATAVSELARNMLQYAGGGTIRFAEVFAPRHGLEAFFEDHGPGIADLDGVLEIGSGGLGLRGSKGIADEFLIDTNPGDGTRITMRKYVA